ncbi:MAG: nucleotide exchange factor GrpE [Chloroflexota bacterium]
MPKNEEIIEEKSGEKSEAQGEATEETLPKEEETVETLSARLEEESQKAKEYLDQWKRSAAEFSNYRKRNEKERGELIKFTNALLITRLLPVLDDLERAFQTLPDNMRYFTWIDGIALVQQKLEAILEQEGLKTIEAQGNPFDPALHQSIMHEETTEFDDGVIMEELQKGYLLNERVIRPALVKVAKKVTKGEEDLTKQDTNEAGKAENDSAR